MLTREQVLAAREALPRKVVKLPALGGDVLVVGMTVGQREAFDRAVYDAREKGEAPRVRARVVQACLRTETGEPMFAEGELDVIETLPAAALDKIVGVAQRLSGLGAAVEDAEGN